MEHRRRFETNVWHWCSNCSGWPPESYCVWERRPYYGELCDECTSRQRGGERVAARDADAPVEPEGAAA